MESADEGPTLTPDELGLLKATLEARLSALGLADAGGEAEGGEAAGGAQAQQPGTRAAFVAAYRRGQQRVLSAALAEVEEMAMGAAEPESEDETRRTDE